MAAAFFNQLADAAKAEAVSAKEREVSVRSDEHQHANVCTSRWSPSRATSQ